MLFCIHPPQVFFSLRPFRPHYVFNLKFQCYNLMHDHAGRTNNYFAQYNLFPFNGCGCFGTGSLNIISILLSNYFASCLAQMPALLLSFILDKRRLFFAEVERCKWTVIIYCLIHNESESFFYCSAEIFSFYYLLIKVGFHCCRSFWLTRKTWKRPSKKSKIRQAFPGLNLHLTSHVYSLTELTTKFISIIITFCLLFCCFASLLLYAGRFKSIKINLKSPQTTAICGDLHCSTYQMC